MREVKKTLKRPDNSMFIRRCIFYVIILAVMLVAAPLIFKAIMVPMAADGIMGAWYCVFIPIAAFMMAIGLFRSWRRRWPLAWWRQYCAEARNNNYEACPRCGSPMEYKSRTRNRTEKIGEEITTTTYSDGSQTKDSKDIYGKVKHTKWYHECSNIACRLEPEQTVSQSHLPWKVKQIRCLVLGDDSALSKRNYNAKSFMLSRLLVPFLALVIVAASAYIIYDYAHGLAGEWTWAKPDNEASRSAEAYESYLLSLDDEYSHWGMSYEQQSTNMISTIKREKSKGYYLSGYQDGTTVYRFFGNNQGTGLADGEYILTKVDGTNVLIDDDNRKIYKQGTEFYDTVAPKLTQLTHDSVLASLYANLQDGEHALWGTTSLKMEYYQKDDTTIYSYMSEDDNTKLLNGDMRAIINHPEAQMAEKFIFSYSDNTYTADLEGFQYADDQPVEQDDELGKLLADSTKDAGGQYKVYEGEEQLAEIDIEVYPDGFIFEIENDYMNFKADEVYKLNTSEKALYLVTKNESGDEVITELNMTQNEEKYDFFVSIVPETYVRKVFDLSKAEVESKWFGLNKSYKIKDEKGNVTCELVQAFGKVQGLVHYISDTQKIAIGFNEK